MRGGRMSGQVGRLACAAMMLWLAAAVAAQTTSPPPPAPSQQMQELLDFAKTHYAKHEYRVAMRDGAKLYTVVYTPVAGQFQDAGPYPFLMSRTP